MLTNVYDIISLMNEKYQNAEIFSIFLNRRVNEDFGSKILGDKRLNGSGLLLSSNFCELQYFKFTVQIRTS